MGVSYIVSTPVSSRFISILISARPHIIIIQVYAPTSDYEDETMKSCIRSYSIIAKVPKKDNAIVQGDWIVILDQTPSKARQSQWV